MKIDEAETKKNEQNQKNDFPNFKIGEKLVVRMFWYENSALRLGPGD